MGGVQPRRRPWDLRRGAARASEGGRRRDPDQRQSEERLGGEELRGEGAECCAAEWREHFQRPRWVRERNTAIAIQPRQQKNYERVTQTYYWDKVNYYKCEP